MKFSENDSSDAERLSFLQGNFQIVKDLRLLPPALQEALKEQNGSRFVIANPGNAFESTDVILDASLPMRRLIFAGVASDRCFIYYERGGIGTSHHLAAFQLLPLNELLPLWSEGCFPDKTASSLSELRSIVATSSCSRGGRDFLP